MNNNKKIKYNYLITNNYYKNNLKILFKMIIKN